jgi:hypothetical protein
MNTVERLKARYQAILANSNDFKAIVERQFPEIPGLFLAGVPQNYDIATNKIMVVGRETRGWGGAPHKTSDDLSHYITSQINRSRDYMLGRQELSKNEKGRSFHNFMRSIADCCGSDGLIWANLYCYSWKKNRIDKSPLAAEIDSLSHELLKTQIDLLRPAHIIFVHGNANYAIKSRRWLFPIDRCIKQADFEESEKIPNSQLWTFEYECDSDLTIQCYRLQHPSSFSNASTNARRFLLKKLLPHKMVSI